MRRRRRQRVQARAPGQLKELIGNLRTDFDDPDLAAIVVEIGESFLDSTSKIPDAHKFAKQVNEGIRQVSHDLAHCALAVAPTTCCEDRVHFDAAGMEDLGRG
eukprot:gene189-594_t